MCGIAGVLRWGNSASLESEIQAMTRAVAHRGPDGDGHVRFAMIENEQRTAQAIRNLRRALVKLG